MFIRKNGESHMARFDYSGSTREFVPLEEEDKPYLVDRIESDPTWDGTRCDFCSAPIWDHCWSCGNE